MYDMFNSIYTCTELKTRKQKPKYRWRQFAFKAASRCWKHWKRSESKETARNPKIQETLRNQKGYNRNRNDQESCLKTAEVPCTSGPSPLQHRRFDYRKCHSSGSSSPSSWSSSSSRVDSSLCFPAAPAPYSRITKTKTLCLPPQPTSETFGCDPRKYHWNLIFIFHIIIYIY